MSDESWRRGRRDNDDDFGPPLFADDLSSNADSTREMDPSDSLSFGDADTGPLPHWTSPPTGEMPATLITGNHPVQDPSDDLDVWSSFSSDQPVWSDDPVPTGQMDVSPASHDERRAPEMYDDELADSSMPVPRGPSRITIGTDPTDERMGRPMPKTRSRSGRVDPSRGTQRPARPGAPTGRTAPAPSGRDMPSAVAVGLVIAAVFIGALLWKPWAVLVVIVVVIALAAVEFYDKVTEKGYRPATIAGIAACVSLPLAAYWVGESAIPLIVVLTLAAACLTFVTSSGIESSPLPNSAITMLGVIWIGVLGSFGALIVSWSNGGSAMANVGTDTLFLLALGVVANDVGALFIGSAAGRTPLRPWISPNKTVEGFVGGAFMTIIAMVIVGAVDGSDTWSSYRDLILLGIVVALAAPLGDLTESMFKRNLEIKDFGSIVKGHGGVLDRFDGFLFTLPAVYYLGLVLTPWLP